MADPIEADFYRSLFEFSLDGMLLTAPDGRIFEANPAACRLFGREVEELRRIGRDGVLAPHNPELRMALERRTRDGFATAELTFVHRDGSQFTAEVTSALFTDRLGEQRSAMIIRDTSARIRVEKEREQYFRFFEMCAAPMCIAEPFGSFVHVNPAFIRLTGYSEQELLSRPCIEFVSPYDRKRTVEELRLETEGRPTTNFENCYVRKDGRPIYLSWTAYFDKTDGVVYATARDITEIKLKDDLLWTQENYDTLTGLPNRRLFQDRLDQEIRKSLRTHIPLAMFLIDLDRFKEVNDTLGHRKGDLLLQAVAQRIEEAVRDSDTVARLGNDEFVVILPEIDPQANMERVAQDIITALGKVFELGEDDTAFVSACIGISLCPRDAVDSGALMQQADLALQKAKAEGRNQFSYAAPAVQTEVRNRIALTNDLRQALGRGELEVYYQPIVDATTRRIAKAEALLRWKHPQLGMVSPATFIPYAESAGLIGEIGDWVFSQVLDNVERWMHEQGRLIQISVNKSPAQFDSPGRCSWAEVLRTRGLPGHCVAVEITEGLLLRDSPKIKQHLVEFSEAGIDVSLDDFGTGFSSLSYLNRFDIDYLKIDRSFVKRLTENEHDKALTEAIIVMARKLGIKTIAEGVETAEQRDILAALGCDYMQGFLYSPAVPQSKFTELLRWFGVAASSTGGAGR